MAPRRLTTRGGRRRGRSLVALALAGFVVVASLVILRRSYGVARSRELSDLEHQRTQLAAERAQLEADIRTLSSRPRLGPVAEQRLGMRVPDDSQVILVPRPSRAQP